MATEPKRLNTTPQRADTNRAWPENWLIRRGGTSWIAVYAWAGRLANGPHTASPLPQRFRHSRVPRDDLQSDLPDTTRRIAAVVGGLSATRLKHPQTAHAWRRPARQDPDMQSIHVRLPDVEGRLIPDHREGHLIKGAGNRSSVGTLVERTTGFVVLAKMSSGPCRGYLGEFQPSAGAHPRARS